MAGLTWSCLMCTVCCKYCGEETQVSPAEHGVGATAAAAVRCALSAPLQAVGTAKVLGMLSAEVQNLVKG